MKYIKCGVIMNKQDILKKYTKEEDRLLIAKVLDKMEAAKSKNKITNTNFLDMYQKNLVKNLLNSIKYENYMLFGGDENSERTVLILYPDKFNKVIVEKNYNNIMQIVEITLPNEMHGKYTHRDYLGGLMKLGIKREKMGDIVVFNEGANIIVLNEIIEFLKSNISSLKRFIKSSIQIKNIEELYRQEIKTEEIQIIVSSLRLDSVVSELAKTSRTKAEEIITGGRTFVNFENIKKASKILKKSDIITIRGKGRFVIKQVERNTKKGRLVVCVEKYV